MRKELVEYAKTVYMDTPLDEIQKHVRDMDELRYVFKEAQKNWRKTPEFFSVNNDKKVIISEEIMSIAREKFKGVDLDTLKTSIVQKELKCGYSVAWRVKDLLKNEKSFKKKINVLFLVQLKVYYKIVKNTRGINI